MRGSSILRGIFFLSIISIIFISGCGKEVICSTPYIVSKGDCCLDRDNDRACDAKTAISGKESGDETSEHVQEEINASEEESATVPQKGTELPAAPSEVSEVGDLVVGNGETKILMYGNYEDEYTKRFFLEVLPQLELEYPGMYQIIFRFFGVPRYRFGEEAAHAALCASEQGYGVEMLEAIMKQSPKVSLSYLRKPGVAIGLDADRMLICAESRRYRDALVEQRIQGISEGVGSVPTFYVDGQRIVGYRDATFFLNIFADKIPKPAVPKPKIVSASSLGKMFLISEGMNPFTQEKASIYSNSLELGQGNFALEASDFGYVDSASLRITFQDTLLKQFTQDTYEITLKSLDRSKFGGVLTERNVFGSTDVFDPDLPTTLGHVVVWGYATIKKNGNVVADDVEMVFFVIDGVRQDTQLQSASQPGDYEAYLILPGEYGGLQQPLSFWKEDFLHLFWEDLILNVR